MKHRLIANLIIIFMLILNAACSQEKESSKIKLTKTPIENTANYAVWRTDFYICTGIAYAKSIGKSPDDFMNFVAETHGETLKSMKGKGLEPLVNLLHFVVTNYPNGTFEIVSESSKTVKVKSNRPYSVYFKNGQMLGVTLDEFEKCLWGHIQIMLKSIDIDFEYDVNGDFVEAILSIRK